MPSWIKRWLCSHDDDMTRGRAIRAFADKFWLDQPVTIFHCKKCGRIRKVWG